MAGRDLNPRPLGYEAPVVRADRYSAVGSVACDLGRHLFRIAASAFAFWHLSARPDDNLDDRRGELHPLKRRAANTARGRFKNGKPPREARSIVLG